MNHPAELRYTTSDWWLRAEEDGSFTLGLAAWRAHELGEIVQAELPEVGQRLQPEQEMGVLEVLKATFDLHAPFAGAVEAVNMAIYDEPSLINADPYGAGWMLRLRPAAGAAPSHTLSSQEYLSLRQAKV